MRCVVEVCDLLGQHAVDAAQNVVSSAVVSVGLRSCTLVRLPGTNHHGCIVECTSVRKRLRTAMCSPNARHGCYCIRAQYTHNGTHVAVEVSWLGTRSLPLCQLAFPHHLVRHPQAHARTMRHAQPMPASL